MAVAVAALLTLAALGCALLPLLLSDSESDRDEHLVAEWEDLERQKRLLVDSMREVDQDLAMGKLSEEDHDELRAELKVRAVAVLRELDGARARLEAHRSGGLPAAEERAEDASGERSETDRVERRDAR